MHSHSAKLEKLFALSIATLLGVSGVTSASAQKKAQSPTNGSPLARLKGKSVYVCPLRIPMVKDTEGRYAFFDTVDANGQSMGPDVSSDFSPKQPAVILLAEQESKNYLKLRLESSVTHTQTSILVSVDRNWAINPLEGVTDNGFLSKVPVPALPKVGMTESDVYCIMGFPEKTNSDAIGGDQLVYLGGHIYVYLSARSHRVVNVQTSY